MNENVKDIAKDLKKALSRLDRVKNEALKNLTDEQLREIAPITADFSRVMKATKDGDATELNHYITKYANIH